MTVAASRGPAVVAVGSAGAPATPISGFGRSAVCTACGPPLPAGRFGGIAFEVTTRTQVGRHDRRTGFGVGLDLATYPFPTSFTDSTDMKTFEKLTIGRTRDRDSGSVFSDFEFRRCEFDDCEISVAARPDRRSTVRNCHLQRCIVRQNCSINTAVVEDCVVDGLETRGPVFVRGAVFKHVVLKGKVGRFILHWPWRAESDPVSPFSAANAEYYRSVDWALDLTQCEAKELQLSGVPGRLIRRDPTTQILVTRERALAVDWRGLPLGGSPYAVCLDLLTKYGGESEVLIAPHRDRSFQACIRAQKVLRDAGVAEPD